MSGFAVLRACLLKTVIEDNLITVQAAADGAFLGSGGIKLHNAVNTLIAETSSGNATD
jgi:hypothetical protein